LERKTTAGMRKGASTFETLRRIKGSGMLVDKKDEVQKKISEHGTKPATVGC